VRQKAHPYRVCSEIPYLGALVVHNTNSNFRWTAIRFVSIFNSNTTEMPLIDSVAAQKLQPELLSGESIYWAAMPNPQVIFHSDDWATIPFSLMWGGFFIFWEGRALERHT
jgi:hypothetical protein